MRMPFGKFRGELVDLLPDDYLEWLAETVDLREPLRSAVHEALASRDVCALYRRGTLRIEPGQG